jgi:hypothetical protein
MDNIHKNNCNFLQGAPQEEDRESQIELEEIPEIPVLKRPPHPPLVHKDSILSSNTSFSEDSEDSEEDFRGRAYSGGRFRRIRGPSPKRECPEPVVVTPILPETPTTPELPESPSYVYSPTKLKHRHSSFNKRLSSTSISSWESENWVPSPPAGRIYHTFSSIEENNEGDEDLKRTESVDSDMLQMKSLPLSVKQQISETFEPQSTSSPCKSESPTSGVCSESSEMNDSGVTLVTSMNRRGSNTSENIDTTLVLNASSLASRRGSLKRQSRVSSVDEENWRESESSSKQSNEQSTQQPSEMVSPRGSNTKT